MSRNGLADVVVERENVLCAEAPLPTYEEVVGETAGNQRFKTDVFLGAASQSHGARNERRQFNGEESRHRLRCKPNNKTIALVLIGLILIPLCISIIINQTKISTYNKEPVIQEADPLVNVYRRCIDEKNDLQRHFDSLVDSNVQLETLRKDYQLLLEQNKKLRDKLKILENSSDS